MSKYKRMHYGTNSPSFHTHLTTTSTAHSFVHTVIIVDGGLNVSSESKNRIMTYDQNTHPPLFIPIPGLPPIDPFPIPPLFIPPPIPPLFILSLKTIMVRGTNVQIMPYVVIWNKSNEQIENSLPSFHAHSTTAHTTFIHTTAHRTFTHTKIYIPHGVRVKELEKKHYDK